MVSGSSSNNDNNTNGTTTTTTTTTDGGPARVRTSFADEAHRASMVVNPALLTLLDESEMMEVEKSDRQEDDDDHKVAVAVAESAMLSDEDAKLKKGIQMDGMKMKDQGKLKEGKMDVPSKQVSASGKIVQGDGNVKNSDNMVDEKNMHGVATATTTTTTTSSTIEDDKDKKPGAVAIKGT